MEKLNPILINIILGIATVVGSTLVPYILVKVGQFIKAKIGGAKGEIVLTAYNQLSSWVYDVVKSAQETFVKEIKAAKKDGKLTKAEASTIKKRVIEQVMKISNSKAMKIIGEDGCNVDEMLSAMIETRLKDIKSEDGFMCPTSVATKPTEAIDGV